MTINKIKNYIIKYNLQEYILEKDLHKFEIRHYEKNEYVVMSKTNNKKLYFFVEGSAKISLFSSEGKEMFLEFIKPFDIFGDVEFILKNDIYYNIQTSEKSTFLEIDFETASTIVNLYKLIAKTLATKLYRTSEKYSLKQLLNSKEIVINFIYNNNKSPIKMYEMAKLVALSERQLRRILNELEEDNIIIKKGKKIEIIDLDAVKEIIDK